MRQIFLLAVMSLLLFSAATMTGQASCPVGDVKIHLDWCSRDHGFNEGATCGLNALRKTDLNGLPSLVSQAILGNTRDRTNMMGAAILAYKAGYKKDAIDAAICCQVHNAGPHECVESHRDYVGEWLSKH